MKTMLRFGGIALFLAGAIMALSSFLAGQKAPQGEVAHQMHNKDKVVSGVYKVYGVKDAPGHMWLAKTAFRNDMNARITDLKVRYKVGEYSDWCSLHNYPAVDPTQTVVDLYYPIFTGECAKLTSRSPAEMQMEFEYIDARGKKHQATESRRLTMLSRNEFIFSDLSAEERTDSFQDQDTYSPLMAAWVSRNDEVVARLAAMANKKAGGLGASGSDEDCIKVMAQLYEIMRAIHISYQHPAVLQDPSLSYDIKTVQSLQYPRDTMQKRSGTCIDLAILYAAMLNSVNIEPFLVSMDGHCFPMARTPSGKFIPVEATGVGDGFAKGMSFEEAVKSGLQTWQKVNQNGRFNLVNVRQCWVSGVANPELESLPPDILEKWGVVTLVEGTPQRLPAGQPGGPTMPAATQPNIAPQPPMPTIVAGRWVYSITAGDGVTRSGQLKISGNGGQLQMVATASYPMMGNDGRMHQFQETNNFMGVFNGQNLVAQCNNATYKMDGQSVPPQGLPLQLNLALGPDGRTMQGQVANALGMIVPIYMQKQ